MKAGEQSRTHHSARNAFVGVLCQMLTMALAIVVRMVFVRTLPVEYQGISGWFSNILSVLNISELGIGTAIVVSLYKPLATGDVPRIRASLRLLRRAYFYVGLAVLALGLLLLPFLPVLLNRQTDLVDLQAVYLMFLAQSVFSYLFWGYKSAIFTADQRQSRIHAVGLLISVFSSAAQILALALWHNYYAYVMVFAAAAALKNMLVARSADRSYPYLRRVSRPQAGEDDTAALPKKERRGIFKNLFGLSLYRFSGTALNTTDNLVLGKFIGFAIIGLYSNYLVLVTALTTMLSLVFQSFTASVGNFSVTSAKERRYFIFRCLNLLGGWLYGFAAVCLLVLLNPLVALLFGHDRILAGAWAVPIIALNFITSGLLENTIMHKDACGLFWQGRYRPVFSAGLNIAFSLWWVHSWGIEGVLLATIVSRLLTTWWFDPWMVHRYALGTGVKGYVEQTAAVLAIALGCGMGLTSLQSLLFPSPTPISLLVMLALCLLVPNAVFYLAFRKREEYVYLKEQALRLFRKLRNRIQNQ
ncbi:MAG: hypothetical protein FWF86_00950 [Clostridia bacterium]|nr:hypothetical protein [Clostridia bacterium]